MSRMLNAPDLGKGSRRMTKDRTEDAADVLREAAATFRRYESEHREKAKALRGGDWPALELALEKVQRNERMAEKCEQMAQHLKPYAEPAPPAERPG